MIRGGEPQTTGSEGCRTGIDEGGNIQVIFVILSFPFQSSISTKLALSVSHCIV